MSFAVPALVPRNPRTAAPPRVSEAPPQTQSPTPSPTDDALASLLEWIPTIPRGCEDEVADAFHLLLSRHYGADASSLPQSPIRVQWTCPVLPVRPWSSTSRTAPPPRLLMRKPPIKRQGQPRRRGTHPRKWTPRCFSRHSGWGGRSWTTPQRGRWTQGCWAASSATSFERSSRPSRTRSLITQLNSPSWESSPSIMTRV